MKELSIIKTADGSFSLYQSALNEHYHSVNGAMQESDYVYINKGFKCIDNNKLNILEVGFGTGLNAMLTYLEAEKQKKTVCYTTLELFPLFEEIYSQLNYAEILGVDKDKYFLPLHSCAWGETIELSNHFVFKKLRIDLQEYLVDEKFDLIYFDAFAPDKQAELWSKTIFFNMFNMLLSGGLLVTYSAKGLVKQNLREAGFIVKRLPGALGKRHMLQAIKP